jgi:hypothetical protein
VEVASGRLLHVLENPAPAYHLTHFAVGVDGAVVVTSAPNRGRPTQAGAIFAALPGQSLVEVRLPPAVLAGLHDETLSVAISDAARVAAVTVPGGDAVVFVELEGISYAGRVALDRPAGVALAPDGLGFVVGARKSVHFIRVDSLEEEPARAFACGFGSISHLLIAHVA